MSFSATDSVNVSQAIVTKLNLYSFDKTRQVSLDNIYLEFNVYEEIFKPYMYGNIVLNDTVDLLTQFPLLGEEWIEIEWTSTLRGDQGKRSYTFFCYSVSEPRPDIQGRRIVYTIHFISPEQFTDSKQVISRNVNDTISNIFTQTLQQNINTTKKINIQPTTVIVNYTFPKLTYFEQLDYLRNKAYINQYQDTNYFLFFENDNGYTFTSLTNLITTSLQKKSSLEANNISTKLFYTDLRADNQHSNFEELTRNIQNGSFAKIKNTLDSIKTGSLSTTVAFYDFNTRQYNKISAQYSNTFTTSVHCDSTGAVKQSNTFLQTFSNTTPQIQFFCLDSIQPDYQFYQNVYGNKLQHFQMFEENPFACTIYGDPIIDAGDILEIDLPEMSSAEDKTYDSYRSGNWIVGRIVHNIRLANYSMHLNLFKDCYKNTIISQTGYLAGSAGTTIDGLLGHV